MGGQCQHLQIEALRLKLAQWEKEPSWRKAFENSASREHSPVVSSGCPALDQILPENGFRPGTLVEWLSYGPGDGAATLAFRAAGCALRAAEAGNPRTGGRGGCRRRVLSSGSHRPGHRAFAAHRRPSGQPDRLRLGIGSGPPLPGGGGNGGLDGKYSSVSARSMQIQTRWPHLSPPATGRGAGGRAGLVDPAGRRPRRAFLGRRATAG